MQTAKKKSKCILGGGAALGFAHIGALEAIAEKTEIKAILGTSMGAIIGALYAVGYSPNEILEIAKEKPFNAFLKLRFNIINDGILSMRKLIDFFNQITRKARIEECRIEFATVAFDLKEKRTVIIKEGSLTSAMIASSNLPFLNKAFDYAGSSLVDGGVCYPLALEFSNIFSNEFINIAVNVLPHFPKNPIYLDVSQKESSSLDSNILLNSMLVNLYNQANLALNSLQKVKPDVYINCYDEQLTAWDFKKIDEFNQLGYHCAKSVLNNNNQKNLIDEIMQEMRQIFKFIQRDFNLLKAEKINRTKR